MLDDSELHRLLSLVVFRASCNVVDGLDVFRTLLREQSSGMVLRFLQDEMKSLEGRVRGGVVFVIAEHYCEKGDIDSLRRLYATESKASVLNALWGEGGTPEMVAEIVALAVEAADDRSPAVRTAACVALQNQSGWKVDVSKGLEPLLRMLSDGDAGVRRQAAFAIGNLAKRRYDVSPHMVPIAHSLGDEDRFVRDANAWALRQMARFKYDIRRAIPGLVRMLTIEDDWNGPFQNAAGALVNYARKSPARVQLVKESVRGVSLNPSRKVVQRFLDQLAKI